MSVNIKRHAYTNYTGKPYIYYNGVSYRPGCDSNCEDEHPYRTIIRNNKSDNTITNTVPLNGIGNLSKIISCANGDAWSKSVRKDNLYKRYNMNCNYAANNLFK